MTLTPRHTQRLVAVAIVLASSGSGQARAEEVVLYQNDFESPNLAPEMQCSTIDARHVDVMHGSSQARFHQQYISETLVHPPGGIYSDPAGLGGSYSLGSSSLLDFDKLALTLDAGGSESLEVGMTISAINLPDCGGPFALSEPVYRLTLVDSPDGSFAFDQGTVLDEQMVAGVAGDSYIFAWSRQTAVLDAHAATGRQVTIVWRQVSGGYAALDNLRIAGEISCLGAAVTAPSPADGASDLSTQGLVLKWQPGADGGCEKWDVRLDGELVCSELDEPSCRLPDLDADRVYRWQVSGSCACGRVAGPEWSFATEPASRVLAIQRQSASPIRLGSVRYLVTFSEPVTGADASDFCIASEGIAGARVMSVAGQGASRQVTVGTGTGNGSLRLDLCDDDSILSGAGVPLGSPGAGNGTFSGGEVYLIDKVKPSVKLSTPVAVSRLGPIELRAQFSEPVTGFDASDLHLAGASVSSIEAVDATTYRLRLMPDLPVTLVSAQVLAGRSFDAAGNASTASGRVQVRYDSVAPFVVSSVRQSASPSRLGSVSFMVTFSEAVSGVDADDFALKVSGIAEAAILRVAGSGATRSVIVSGGSGDGSIRLDVRDDDSILDLAGSPLGEPGRENGAFDRGESYAIDRTRPAATLGVAGLAGGATIPVTVTFSEPVSGFDLSDLALSEASAAHLTGSGTVYRFELTPASSRATARLMAGRAADAAGNVNLPSNLFAAGGVSR